jgi:hypothetical protein
MPRSDKFICFNPKTNEITFSDSVDNPSITPFIYCDYESPLSSTRFCIWHGLAMQGWTYVSPDDPRIPQKFKTLLLLLGVSYEDKT